MERTPGTISVDHDGSDRVTVRLAGEFDTTTKAELVAALNDAVAAGTQTVVDVSAVTFFDSSGVNAVAIAHRAAVSAGRQLRIAGAHGLVAEVLHQTGMAALLA